MPTGAEALVRTLEAHDVEHVFGVCGDTSIGFYRALADLNHELTHVLARDERSAGYMADAYARLSNRPGVCEGPSGGGATYLLPGIAEANDSAVPLVSLNTNVPVRYRGRGVLTELDQERLFDPVSAWTDTADHPNHVPRLLRQAFRTATTGRPGATHVSFPLDVLNRGTDERIYAEEPYTRYPAHRPPPTNGQIDRAAELLAESDRPVIVAGGGIHTSRAWDEVGTLAKTISVPVAQTLTSAGCLGDHPYSIGVVGENGGSEYANQIIGEAETLVLLGTAVESVWTSKWSRPEDGEKTIIHVDIDPETIGRNYETELAIPADLRTTVRQLIDRIESAEKWSREAIEARREEWRKPYVDRFDADDFPLRPERVVGGAAEVLDEDAVLVSDPGTSCPYFAALYPFSKQGRHWVTPRAHGALGYTIPGLVGAHYARPDSQIIGFTGDGSVGMSVGELETIGRLGIPVTVVVLNNASFSGIEAGQRSYCDFSFGVDFEGLDYAAIAEQFGLTGFRVDEAAEYETVLQDAVDMDKPALVDLPTRPLPELEDTPVDWLSPDE
jgi:acetolactate synthase-1/2/3 large subunit